MRENEAGLAEKHGASKPAKEGKEGKEVKAI
jgi:hypothetical protein